MKRASGRDQPSALDERDARLFRRFGWGPARAVPRVAIHEMIERHAAARPSLTAAEHGGERITYGELERQANRLAALLIHRGVSPGDRVALVVRRGIPMIIGILAILKAGAAYVPQDAKMVRNPALRHILATADCTIVLTQSDAPVELPPGVLGIDIDRARAEAPDAPAPRIAHDPSRACYILFTSGTTGTPNGVAVTHANLANLLLTEPGDLGIRPGTTVGQILNIAFDMAAWEILGCLSHGGTLLIRGDDIAATARRVNVLIATPTILSRIEPEACEHLRTVAVAGEPCPGALADRWAARSAFYNGCGPTETTIVNTMQRHRPGLRLTIGRPTPNNTVYILDEHRNPCPIGEVGEMWAGGDGVSAGYLANPGLNAERYAPDPFLGGGRTMFRTRDLGRWTRDGELEHFGRTDDQVKVRGFRVELDAVSAVLEGVPGCVRAATVKLDDRTLASFVQPAQVDPALARKTVAEALPYYCVPESIHILEALPLTDRGKIDKTRLLRLARLGREATA
ncbi:amino acid adenylation domain-containing protein [Glycomyces tritici]|uniref:Amino acid adenylation domain-containing protein n=1 Tax=Glycomyces tritici TaxID=2665176 RepID=A0ABT7YXU2_9ACTN|nr:amino acid adenylation domain-containing protein [Glycomyces tritici]MDN3243451.1 amino acid adenylation domain-containing protein [Glycomyces tritici]